MVTAIARLAPTVNEAIESRKEMRMDRFALDKPERD
jgi:hypothetical protein